MLAAYDPHAPKRAVNLGVNGDLLHKARDLNINLSATWNRLWSSPEEETA
ncbi:type II toxin-antitoxin system CcdA family antitoxin [Pseudomonas sp. CBC3]